MTASWVKQAGNIEFLIMAIGGMVFFTLLLVTGNTMALSVRERMGELAVMKAVASRSLRPVHRARRIAHRRADRRDPRHRPREIDDARRRSHRRHPVYSSCCRSVRCCSAFSPHSASECSRDIIPATNAMRLRVVDALRRA